jgi:CRISPR-associated protein Cpf1
MDSNITSFSFKYSLSKTLRFELKPVGKTLENIQNKGLIAKDEERSKSYARMKKTIDAFHKYFIELAMKEVELTKLNEYVEHYYESAERKKEDSFIKSFDKVKADLRKEIVKGFNSDKVKEIFSKIDKKELITELLEDWIQNQPNKEEIYFDEGFKTFTTYFGGFHENRKNMYSDKEQSTAIAYRLIHENLPKFLDNIKNFEDAVQKLGEEKIAEIEKTLEPILQGKTLGEVFILEYFNHTLTQTGIELYNTILGGYTQNEGRIKIQGLNEYFNLYNQTQQDKKNKAAKLKPLYKQILSDRGTTSFLIEKFENSQEVLDAINEFYLFNLIEYKPEDKDETENVLSKLKELLAELSQYDLSKIYLKNDRAITDISQTIFGDWNIIKVALEQHWLNANTDKNKALTKKQEEAKSKFLSKSQFSIAEIEAALFAYKNEADVLKDLKESDHPIADYFKTHFKAKKEKETDKDFDLIANIDAKHSCIKGVLNSDYPEDKKLYQQQKDIDNIKIFLESIMELLHFVKPLALTKGNSLEKEDKFYGQFETWFEQLSLLTPLYDKVRNYATQKAYSIEKFKLNFESGYFFSGWGIDYDSKSCLVVIKDENYYLLIVDKKLQKSEIEFLKENVNKNPAQRVIYDFQKPDNKNVPRLFIRSKGDRFAPAVHRYNLPIDSIIDIYDNGYFKTEYRAQNLSHFKECLSKLIDYFKLGFERHESYKHYQFNWKNSTQYNDIAEFYKDVINSCYQLKLEEINFDNLLELINLQKGYLFQIYNKDFSEYSKGKPNMHTMYWRALFDEENLKDVVYKLNGEAELFYRKKSIDDDKKIIHKANEKLANKNPLNPKRESKFEYELIKDKRFTVDKFSFHVPITMNFKADGNDYINQDVLKFLKNNPDVNIIGLDRGERHLIYLTLINQKGEILDGLQFSLNEILNTYKNSKGENVELKTSYHTLLDAKEKERDEARKTWKSIENIKELKEGYISQVVHIIAKMMVEFNAIVVMEDLNFGFKRGRFKVEKQVYQKLEKMLIDKLNYLVFKDVEESKSGGLYNALQLTNKFTSFKEMGKQSGFLFYVPAWNTSKIDPTTGFVNLFDTRYESIEKAQQFFKKFKSIQYNSQKQYFEFAFDYSEFTNRAEGSKTNWKVCTQGDRIITFRNPESNNQWINKKVNLSQEFEDFFGKHNVIYGNGENFQPQIEAQTTKEFFEKLLQLFKLTVQMRNSKSDEDYLISPVINKTGEFYDSREANDTLPKDADANGAYHIAKKGLWVLEQINETEDYKKLKLAISNKEWLQFVQKNN